MCLNYNYQTKFVPKEDPIYAWKVFRKTENGRLGNLFAGRKIGINSTLPFTTAPICPKFTFEIGKKYISKNIVNYSAYKGFHAWNSRSKSRLIKKSPQWYGETDQLVIYKVKLWGKIHFDDGGVAAQYMEILPIRG